MQLAVLYTCLLLAPTAAPDTVVVVPKPFTKALEPWLEHRAAQGHTFAFVHDVSSADGIRSAIREVAKRGKLQHIVLVGDAPGLDMPAGAKLPLCIPTHYEPAKVNVRWGSEPEIATDNWYADLDDDRVPDVAIGRIPADNPWQLAAYVRKMLEYENTNDVGAWRRKINLVAGMGDFGVIADTVIDAAARKLITDGVPPGYETSMTQANWRSPYCPAPAYFNASIVNRLNEGCLFFVYIGHGYPYRLDNIDAPDGKFPILNAADVTRLKAAHGAPVGVFFACYTAAFDAQKDCLAEELLKVDGGPVAVIGGSRVTMPYGMSVLAMSLLEESFSGKAETLGEIVLQSKRRTVSNEAPNSTRKLIDSIASVVSPTGARLADERLEHLSLMNLLGDPLLAIRRPRQVQVQVKENAMAGETIEVVGRSPVAGACRVELVCRRDRLTFTPTARRRYDNSPTGAAAFNETYERANDPTWNSKTVAVKGGDFRTTLVIPADCHGPCHVRVFVEGDDDFALGATDINVKEAHTAKRD